MGDHLLNPFGRGTKVQLPPVACDGFGRELSVGDLIALTKPSGLASFHVIAVTPVLDPKQPANLLELRLRAEIKVVVRAGQPTAEIVRLYGVGEEKARVIAAAGGGDGSPGS